MKTNKQILIYLCIFRNPKFSYSPTLLFNNTASDLKLGHSLVLIPLSSVIQSQTKHNFIKHEVIISIKSVENAQIISFSYSSHIIEFPY